MRLAPPLLALLAPGALAGQVLVVDDDGPADFADLQPAVDAAADGDVVLVKGGHYGGFQLVGKGLTVLADVDTVVTVHGPIVVEGVPAGSLAVVRGLTNADPIEHGIAVLDCDGAVRVEGCELTGWQTPTEYATAHLVGHGAYVDGSDDVWIARCTLTGGPGSYVGPFFQPADGGSAVVIRSSTVAVVGCDLFGSQGVEAPMDDWWWGGNGGHGVALYDSRVWVGGCSGQAGHGGYAWYDYDALFGIKECGNGGHGGSGVYVAAYDFDGSFVPAPSEVVVRDLSVVPGWFGGAWCGDPGTAGEPVEVIDAAPHAVTLLDGAARDTYASSPIRGGDGARVYAEGEPGDLFVALVGEPTPPLAIPGQPVPLGLAAPAKILVLGVVPAGGTLLKTVATPVPPPGSGGATVHLQGVLVPAGGTDLEAAPVGTLTLLEPAY